MNTATSSVVAVLNAHPRALVLFEPHLGDSRPERRGLQFLRAYPAARSVFGQHLRFTEQIGHLAAVLEGEGHRFDVIGEKDPRLDLRRLHEVRDARVIYVVRDVRTWLAKRQVRIDYAANPNLMPAATHYVSHYIESFRLPSVLHLTTEEFVSDNQRAIDRLADFVGLRDLHEHASRWWTAIQAYPTGPKTAVPWWEEHRASLSEPSHLDTTVEVRSGTAMDEVLEIFDRWYRGRGESIDGDQARLRRLAMAPPLCADEFFLSLQTSTSHSRAQKRARSAIRTRLWRSLRS
jgi:hypothetical protein